MKLESNGNTDPPRARERECVGRDKARRTLELVHSSFGMHVGDPNNSVMSGWQWLHNNPVRFRAQGEMLSQGQGLCGDGAPSQQYKLGQAMS